MEDAHRALVADKIEQAKTALQDGKKAAQNCCKLILVADKSEFGWSAESEYAERNVNKRKKDKERRPSLPSSVLRLPSRQDIRSLTPQRQIGPCFKISIFLTLNFRYITTKLSIT